MPAEIREALTPRPPAAVPTAQCSVTAGDKQLAPSTIEFLRGDHANGPGWNPPRSVVEMSLRDWKIVAASGKQAVQHANGAPMGYHANNVPALSPHLFPVIVWEANGTTLVLDGSHRLACYLLNNCPSIKAVVVTVAEARSCINGSHSRFDKATGLLP